MSHPIIRFVDRAKETTTTTSTGPISLGGAVDGFVRISGVGDGNSTYYTIEEDIKFEVGIGTYTLSSNTLSRDEIFTSSNSDNSKIDLGGSGTVFVTYSADKAVSKTSGNYVGIGIDPEYQLQVSGTGSFNTVRFHDGSTQLGLTETISSSALFAKKAASSNAVFASENTIMGLVETNTSNIADTGASNFTDIVSVSGLLPKIGSTTLSCDGFSATSGFETLYIGKGLELSVGTASLSSPNFYNSGIISICETSPFNPNGESGSLAFFNPAGTQIVGSTGLMYYTSGINTLYLNSDSSLGDFQMNFTSSEAGATPITIRATEGTDNHTGTMLAFDGTEGRLLSISDNISTGSLFTVSDIVGLPLIEVNASGDVKFIEYSNGRYVGIATGTPQYQLDVNGTGNFTSGVRFPDGITQTVAFTGHDADHYNYWSITADTGGTGNVTSAIPVNFLGYGGIATSFNGSATTPAIAAYTAGTGNFTALTFDNNIANIDSSGNATFNNITASGNLTVSGTLTYIDSTTVTIADKQLELASNSGTAAGNDAYVDDGGIVLKSTDGDKKWTWLDATDAWHSTENISLASSKSITFGDGTVQTTSPTGAIEATGSLLYTNVSDNADSIATNESDIATNVTNIAATGAKNAADIATVSGLSSAGMPTASGVRIETNSSNITTLFSSASTNSSNIVALSTATGLLSTATGINQSNIETNTTNIATNVTNIASTGAINAADILIVSGIVGIPSASGVIIDANTAKGITNASVIASNMSNISTNTTNIATNVTNIAATGATNAANITTVSGLVTTYTAGTGLVLVGTEFNTAGTGYFDSVAIATDGYIYHSGDPDTYIQFTNDEIQIAAGGRTYIKIEEDSTDKLMFNHGALDIDLQVKGENDANLIRTDAENDRVGISTASPAFLLDVNGSGNFTDGIVTSGAIKTPLISNEDGATVTCDLNSGNVHTVTLGGNRVIALANAGTGQKFMTRLVQDASGSRTVTWFNTIKWAGGSAPTLTTTGSKTDVFGFLCTSVSGDSSQSGSFDGFVVGQNI